MRVHKYAKAEVQRQHATNVEGMVRAVHLAREFHNESDLLDFVRRLGALIEPDVNRDGFRRSEVSFRRPSTSAARAVDVPPRMERWAWLYWQMDDVHSFEQGVDEWIKAFLDIHPFVDGNGRVASVLRNWALYTLDDPTPLPNYYSQEKWEQEAQ